MESSEQTPSGGPEPTPLSEQVTSAPAKETLTGKTEPHIGAPSASPLDMENGIFKDQGVTFGEDANVEIDDGSTGPSPQRDDSRQKDEDDRVGGLRLILPIVVAGVAFIVAGLVQIEQIPKGVPSVPWVQLRGHWVHDNRVVYSRSGNEICRNVDWPDPSSALSRSEA